jgi:hypothetical protein
MVNKIAILFIFLYYIRPQDWVQGLAGFNIMRPMIAIWLVALMTSRDQISPRRIMATPHDWLMLLYLAYVVWTAPDSQAAFQGFFPLVVFYAFTVHSLNSWQDVLSYLKAWNFILITLSVIAAASLYGFDLTGAVDLTAQNKGRLCIGTWMHNNPNALAHSVIVVLPLSFLLYFWRGSFMERFFIFPLLSTPALFCAYHTQSKGAFLVGGLLFILLFVVGRPLIVKLFALAVALTAGVSALSFLPRMSEMGNLRADEGVQGRLLAWEVARTTVESYATGLGWKQFIAYINWYGLTERKATHSAYVQVAADLGVYGLFIYLGALWAAFRSTVSVFRYTRENEMEERCRRSILVLLAAYVASSWMINREYHTEYFLIIALAAVLHRLCQTQNNATIQEADLDHVSLPYSVPNAGYLSPFTLSMETPLRSEHGNAGALALPYTSPPGGRNHAQDDVSEIVEVVENRMELEISLWNRLTIVDLAVSAALTWSVIYVWDYILKNL